MNTLGWFLVPVVCVSLTSPLVAQVVDSQQAMHQRIMALYDFHPHAVTDAAREQKSNEMDAFWNEVKQHRQTDLPLLRAELSNPQTPGFFRMDGAQLLLSLSSSPADQALAATAMSTADLSDVTPSAYFYSIHQLSMKGVDTTAASLHILDDPNFVVSVPQHAMVLRPPDCLLFLVLPVDPSKWLTAVSQKIAAAKSPDLQQALVTLVFYAQTPESDRILDSIASNVSLPESARKAAANWKQAAKEAYKHKVDVPGDEAQIREARRQRLNAVSDEAIDDVQEMTVRIIQLRHATAGS
jgi:hypothetical protein